MPRRSIAPDEPDHWRASRPLLGSAAQIVALACAALALFFSLVAGAAPTQGGKQDPATLYHNYCSVCHGDRGDGRSRAQNSLAPPPRDFTQPSARGALTRDYMIAVTREGKPGTAMAGWKRQLGEREIAGVVDYVRTNFMQLDLPQNLARGRDIYQSTCSVCHGEKGDGNSRAKNSLTPPPRDFTNAAIELNRSHMIFTVNKGHPNTAMVSFASQLSAAEIEAVVNYIRSAFVPKAGKNISGSSAHGGKEHDTPAHGRRDDGHDHGQGQAKPARPLPKGLKGDAARGAKFYVANCAACHGEKGDGKGPRAYFINPKPRNFIDASSRASFSRADLFAAISIGRRGSEMPAWGNVIGDQQIADVAEYVFRQFVRPGNLPQTGAAQQK